MRNEHVVQLISQFSEEENFPCNKTQMPHKAIYKVKQDNNRRVYFREENITFFSINF